MMTIANEVTGIGRKVRALRLARGFTQQELAFRSGLSLTGIAKYEQGVHLPSIPTLRRLASALGVSMAELLDEAALLQPAEIAA